MEIKVGNIVNTPLGIAKVVGAGRGVVTVFSDKYGEKLFAMESVSLYEQDQDKGAIPGEVAYVKHGVPYIEQEAGIPPKPIKENEPQLKPPEVKFQKVPMPEKIPAPKMYSVYNTIYKKLIKVVPLDIIQSKVSAGKSIVPGLMDLGYDYLREDKNGNPIIALHHYYKHPSGDMIADPDMEIRVMPDQEMAEALTFQDLYGYRRVYPEPGKVNLIAKKELNQFLNIWLSNLIKQGHKISVSK